jgi:P4 family phage/plasmid primase-like protien
MNQLVQKTAAWLRDPQVSGEVGETVLMPLKEGKKEPQFRHAVKGSYGWSKYDAFVNIVKNHGHEEWGLLLDRLCIVDADDTDAVTWLETMACDGTAPELARCPVQETNKGRHYFFLRPDWADVEGFWDGARQASSGVSVDFKSVSSTGTRGLLCVAPSKGKRWVEGRELWTAELETMPRVLLEAIAKPKKVIGIEKKSKRVAPTPPKTTSLSHPVVTLPSSVTSDDTVKLLNLLSKARWDDYSRWRDVATVLKNEYGEKYRTVWFEMSRISPRFELDAAIKVWDTVARSDYHGRRLSMRTLKSWAKTDDPIGYQAYRAATVHPLVLAKYNEGDRGLAEIAHHMLGAVVKRVGTKGKIYYFEEEECRWKCGDEASIMLRVSYAVEEALRDVDAHLSAKASTAVDGELRNTIDEQRKKVVSRMEYLRKRNGMSNITALAVRLCQDDEFEQMLDARPYLLGVRNGVVDLRNGEVRQREPEDMIFTVLDFDYDPDAPTTFIEDTVKAIMADDMAMVAYLQKVLGYAITGEVCEEIFLIFTAGGRNGKGLLMQSLMEIMGRFYVEMNCGIIISRQVSNLDAERGKLLGARIAVFNELESGEKLKTSEVQMLSGGDGIPAAPKYQDPITIRPRHLCILTTNHMPELSEVKVATIERVIVVPFPVTFTDLGEGEVPTATRRQRDNGLKDKLKEDKKGMLTWLVKGAVAWYATKDLKRNAPDKVKEFSKKYFEEQDRLGKFIKESFKVGEGELVSAEKFFELWKSYGAGTLSKPSDIVKAMEAKGFTKSRTRLGPLCRNPISCYHGLSIIEAGDEYDELEEGEEPPL